MDNFNLEYAIALIQRDIFSFAAKSHRREGGDPKLIIDTSGPLVTWRVTELIHGIPDAITGQPQQDRFDFYFTVEELRNVFTSFPSPVSKPNKKRELTPTTSEGTERIEGKRVRMVLPIKRFYPIDSIEIFVQQIPSFEIFASDAYLHLDIETGPSRIYGQDIFEVHFGVQAEYNARKSTITVPSYAYLKMSHELYATIHNRIRLSIR